MNRFKIPFNDENQLSLYKKGFKWQGGDCVEPIKSSVAVYIVVNTLNNTLSFNEDTQCTLTDFVIQLKVHKVLTNGYVVKTPDYYKFIPFSNELLEMDLYDAWLKWLVGSSEESLV